MAAHGVLNLSTWKQPHPVLAAVQHIRRMCGGSQAHLLAASDGNLYITKFQNNPQHVRILASEFLATRLAHSLDLAVPQAEVIAVSDCLIEANPSLRIETAGKIVPCSSGLHLGLRYAADLWQDRIKTLLEPSVETLFGFFPQIADIVGCNHRLNIGGQPAAARTQIQRFVDKVNLRATVNKFAKLRPVLKVSGRTVNLVHQHARGFSGL